MTQRESSTELVKLDINTSFWDRCFMVAPLVLVGTRDADGSLDLAPKHMALPMGWSNYFGFICSPSHHTHTNIERTGEFTVSYPKPSQVLYASLAASPRKSAGPKTVLAAFDTFAASEIDGELVRDSYLFLECRQHKIIDGFGKNCLITGEVVAAYADPDYVRGAELDEQEQIHEHPLFAYLPPSRFATISRSNAFPFPADMKK